MAQKTRRHRAAPRLGHDYAAVHPVYGVPSGLHMGGADYGRHRRWLYRAGRMDSANMEPGILSDLLVNGVIAGLGSVLVFLPQITILFAFILLLEDSGYLPRAAFLLDNIMAKSGLSGRSFIPLLSSFACAVPAVMSARTINDPRERLVTIAVAPLLTCSARLPVYALIIAAVIPDRTVGGIFNLQGLTLFILYIVGILSAALAAYIMKRLARMKGNVQHSRF